MALSDLTFKLYTDSGLTTQFTGTYTQVHKTDLSDNPHDYKLYFGSNTADRILYAVSAPGVDNITLTPTGLIPVWSASTAYAVGIDREPTVSNGYRYEVTVAGTTGATQPTWPTAIGSTVTDGTVTWINRGAKHPTTEIKLAATAGGLDSAIAGAPLSLGTTIESGVANAKEINIRLTNSVTNVSESGIPEIGININNVQEEADI